MLLSENESKEGLEKIGAIDWVVTKDADRRQFFLKRKSLTFFLLSGTSLSVKDQLGEMITSE